ncbi:Tyr recombinase domain-containing protein [Vibrio crassostreae]|uniref:gamma-mobile-trio recombinase GmtY n=1 Tax=Vibrio crassostreae TaxID=246167 RepID=UPI001B30F590|nr:gamma-mobile-trio recombinase GmtY [Vibrio crassostreae]CAK2466326.1 Tyr recombinase domain-containing protein [Vibrio crassostreae]CAK3343077.1 Tyr recombinase domain-containing protein [Vibrio crassostreae]
MFSSVVKVNVKLDNHDLSIPMRAIVVDGEGVLISHLRFMLEQKMRKGVKSSWIDKSIHAVRLLLDYTMVNKDCFDDPHELFKSFAERIFGGTIAESGEDTTQLRWKPRSIKTGNEIIYHVTMFSDWLYEQSDGTSSLLNPQRKASPTEMILNLAAYNHRMNNAFLKHTFSNQHKSDSVNWVRTVQRRQLPSIIDEPKKPFSEDKIFELLTEGFNRKGVSPNAPIEQRFNLANILITMLMHFGGLRNSEVFHLYIDDIIPNAGYEQIRVYHPTQGFAPEWYRIKTKNPFCTRGQFLQEKYGLNDRLTANDKYHAGWKNPVVNEEGKYFAVFFFGLPGIKELFYRLFRIYVTQQRVPPLIGREHPFLFTNRNGDPLTMKSFKRAHQIAVKKIGISHYLNAGGSPHSHRHAYAQRLADAREVCPSINEIIIQRALHHKSADSQKVYTEPDIKKVEKSLAKAEEMSVPQELPFGFGK